MRVVKVSEASGAVLDWLVGTAQGYELSLYGVDPSIRARVPGLGVHAPWAPSKYWNQAGPIIDREIGNLWKHNKLDPSEPDVWTAAAYRKAPDGTMLYYEDGPTPLIAAMRCFVSSKLGEEVEVPEELCE